MLDLVATNTLNNQLTRDIETLGALHKIASNKLKIKQLQRRKKGLRGLEEISESSVQVRQEDIDALFTKVIKECVDITYKTAILFEVLSVPTGFASDFLTNSNMNPSNLKTTGTVILAAIFNTVVTTGYFLFNIAKILPDSATIVEEKFKDSFKRIDFKSIDKFTKTINEAITNGLITERDGNIIKEIYTKNVDKYFQLLNITRFVEGGARLASAYHGYKRNEDSIGYALLWAVFGGTTALGVALHQGYGKPLSEVEHFRKSK